MRSIRNRWIRGVGAVVLVGALLVTSVVAADDDKDKGKNPFTQILQKLDQILAAITGIGGGGGGNHTLRWDTNNPPASRFTTAFTGAVLDHNTGLVWEQAPDITGGPNSNGRRDWGNATSYCVNKNVGGTRGWRLPSVAELASLIDPSLPAPFVPGTVFTGVQSGQSEPANYWSATTLAVNPTYAWSVFFEIGRVNDIPKSDTQYAWCVRGGMNADAY